MRQQRTQERARATSQHQMHAYTQRGAPTGQLSMRGVAGMCMETLCTATGVDRPCAPFAQRTLTQEETCQHRCSTRIQHGEMGRESGCRSLDMFFGGYCVVYEGEGASQKPPCRREAQNRGKDRRRCCDSARRLTERVVLGCVPRTLGASDSPRPSLHCKLSTMIPH